MGLINAKCPECGAVLKISEQAKGELRCPYCGSTYLAESVIHITNVNSTTINNTNIRADRINIETQKACYRTVEVGFWELFSIRRRAATKLNVGYVSIFVNGERIGNITPYQSMVIPIDMNKVNTIRVVPSIDGSSEKSIVIGPGIQMETDLILYTIDIIKYNFFDKSYSYNYSIEIADKETKDLFKS
ncbi:MAG: hypothetical protein J6Y42_01375 [Bacilli bacterium]|nr:hypothetical protein [Bacilli bacterium]